MAETTDYYQASTPALELKQLKFLVGRWQPKAISRQVSTALLVLPIPIVRMAHYESNRRMSSKQQRHQGLDAPDTDWQTG